MKAAEREQGGMCRDALSTGDDVLSGIYRRLFERFGPQHWWPGETPFEVVVGAILTQNTNWANVEKAIRNLKEAGVLSPQGLRRIPEGRLAALIRPSGYFRVKAGRLKAFITFLHEICGGRLERLASIETGELRRRLLDVRGIGPETADSILLYGLDRPVFVVDAYTRRILYRHGIVPAEADYHEVQGIFQRALPGDLRLFNEYHALIVRLGKTYCRPRPDCGGCPLKAVRYSLRARCGRCFRWLPRRVDRRRVSGGGYLCRPCLDGRGDEGGRGR